MAIQNATPSRIARPLATPRRSLSSTSLAMSYSSRTPAAPMGHSKSHSSSTSGTGSARSSIGSSRKYKAPLSAESKPRNFPRTKTPLPTVPASPSGKSDDGSKSRSGTPVNRPRTPGTPSSAKQRRPESVCGNNSTVWGRSMTPVPGPLSEMDVSNVNPEDVLVDSKTVEPADVSGEIDLDDIFIDQGKQDKVMVSIRIRPSENPSAWICDSNTHPSTANSFPSSPSAHSNSNSFTYDAILTGAANKPIYTTTSRAHVQAAMDGYNAVIFAYGQTCSGKTYTLSGDSAGEEPGIIPRSMREVFATIKRTPDREYLLRCSYLEIYNETIYDLLAPPGVAAANPVQIQGGIGNDITLSPLREEVVTSLKGVKEVLRRGEAHRRTACTDWNERSSRSHSVFRMVIESREKDESVAARQKEEEEEESISASLLSSSTSGRRTPAFSGKQTPGIGFTAPRLQSRGGKSVRTSVLSLIDLAGSEKATSDKERTREGRYINTSLLTLGSVIGTLADNASKRKNDHVPYRNSKLTRMIQPSLSGNARISVICTINPDQSAISESTSTLLFARRIKNVKLNAQKKEVVDTDALIERYKKEIEDLKQRLAEREKEAETPARTRRLSTKEKADESKAMKDLNARITQLTRLILTSQSVDDGKGDDSRPASPVKIDFDMSPYQLQQELLAAKTQIESQETQILSLEAALLARPVLPPTAPEHEKDNLIAAQAKTIRELEIVVRGYEDNLGEPLIKVKEDVENEWTGKLEEEINKREEQERWAEELVRQLDRERKVRKKLEDERRALASFVSKFDSLGLGMTLPPSSSGSLRTPTKSGIASAKASPFADRKKRFPLDGKENTSGSEIEMSVDLSPMKMDWKGQQQLTMEQLPEETSFDISFDCERLGAAEDLRTPRKSVLTLAREVFGGKENTIVP
ncbi:kinesin-domain-containing protein [Amanita rubescens]|nr:kinesin-domain-containing protein [Amanita rubescens]